MSYCFCNTRFLTLILFLFGITLFQNAFALDDKYSLSSSVVKIHVTSKSFDESEPWNTSTISGTGTGFVIDGNRIITNAHIVEDSTFIEVQLDGDSKRYKASTIAISHETDLALITLEDKNFFAKIKPLQLGKLPNIHQKVVVYGYPIGGDALSITEGVISRIEYQNYAHSSLAYLAIQVDAAINYGNSGGAAIVENKVVGVVMQFDGAEDNSGGYIIPVSILKRFLNDISDGKSDGIPYLPINYQKLESPVLREGYYKLPLDQSGILITRVCANTEAEGVLQQGDIIKTIDGKKIENNARVFGADNTRFTFMHYIDLHQVNDTLKLEIVRKGKTLTINLPLKDITELEQEFDQDPRYFVYGGYVFIANKYSQDCITAKEYKLSENKNKIDSITLVNVLPTSHNTGTHQLSQMEIAKVNQQTFNSFKEFYCLLSKTKTPIILLQNSSGTSLAIDREVANKTNADTLEKYQIHKSQSVEVDQWEKNTSCVATKTRRSTIKLDKASR
ncbi:MAG: trypsin-like peptidase domain-containing protein [Cocleimonas sp.]|nr:trypsin-like peptidase domain-containing protein [Cocleimonas sp.]